ncbi:uncharacterized protein LOC132295158 isoform X2 [Cornus florida]|nr:uncharacterized protein LOC132295158 isoform X2 [Cornus florida]
MSPASKSKSKSKDKSSAKVAKEQQKASSKVSGSTSMGNGSPASAYNPISGTFHTLDTAPMSSSPPLQSNGRFRNIETDEQSGSLHVTGPEYDSLSNNGSTSGESEDHKEKTSNVTPRQEAIPGSDNDKREKIRQKNERKHQRQREKRAQELHKRCSDYLMSRKLEVLSQQLVSMGFSSEQATLALILNEGKVEESVSWLFEGSEEAAQKKDPGSGADLKIDISEELAQITAMEMRYKCSKQEVERAVVSCEGDLKKAEEILKAQKAEPPIVPLKLEETADPKDPVRSQQNPLASVTIQQRRNERDPNYARGAATLSESSNGNMQSLKTNKPKSLAEKRWPTTISSSSVSYSTALPIQVAPASAKTETQHIVGGHEGRNTQQGVLRESVIMMQRPQSLNIKQNLGSSASCSPPGTSGLYVNNNVVSGSMRSNGKLLQEQRIVSLGPENMSSEHFHRQVPSIGNMGLENLSSQQIYPQNHYTQCRYMSGSVEPEATRLGGSWSSVGASSPSLTVPSSLGLFSGWGSTGTLGSSSQVDWSAGDLMSHCDYNSIDWTLESNSAYSKQNGGLFLGQSNGLMLGLSSMRIAGTNGICIAGLQDGGMASETTSSAGLREWTSPFAGKDIFSVPRQFVTSPSP